MFAKIIIYCVQIVMTTITKSWLLLTRRLTYISPPSNNFTISRRYIYVANHASYLDPIVMWSVLNFQQRMNGAPTKVMTAPFVYFSLLRPIVWLLGAYPAKNKHNTKVAAGVHGSLEYINHGYNICIFPEGKRSLEEEKRAFNGVSQILANVDEYEMVLVRIKWGSGPWYMRKLDIRAELAPSTLDHHNPQAIMNHIYSM